MPQSSDKTLRPVGAILAGGASRRMGTPKPVLELGGQTLLARAAQNLQQQVSDLVVVGGEPAWAEACGLSYRPDAVEGGRGPLAGLLSAMDFAADKNSGWVFVTAADMPFLPVDIVDTLLAAASLGRPVIPTDEKRSQPLAALWPTALRESLRQGLDESTIESLRDFYEPLKPVEPTLSGTEVSPFFNVNRPEDLEEAAKVLARLTKLA